MSAQSSFAQALTNDLSITERSGAPIIDPLSAWRRFGSARRYVPGEEFFRQGALPDGVYCIASGYVKLSALDQDGRELIVGLREAGVILGLPAVILEEAYRVSATAITYCESQYIPTESFIPLLKADPRFSWLILREQSHQASQQLAHILQLGFYSARKRLCELLLHLLSSTGADHHQEGALLQLPLKQWEVAQLIAVTPEHLSRIVRQMQQQRILQWTKGTVTVFDLKRLRDSITA